MGLNDSEQRFLATQRHGRLATVAPGGAPQVKPVGFSWNASLGTIDIYGMEMEKSAKFRNIRVNPAVSFVVDEVVREEASGVRFLEIRGTAEARSEASEPDGHLSREFIRIAPRRVVSWNLDPERPGFSARDLEPAGAPVSS